MCQEKFIAAEAILNPPSVTPKNILSSSLIASPIGVRKGSANYYRAKLNQSLDLISTLTETSPSLEDVPGLMPYKKIIPKKSKNQRLTKMRGSMKGSEVLKAAEERRQLQKEQEEKEEAL